MAMPTKSPVVAIIQARMGSTRLPGKVLMDLAGKPMLARVVERVRSARKVDAIVVATSNLPADDPIESFCRSHGVLVFRGSEDDVLDRFSKAAIATSAATVVRVTADCPLIDANVLDEVIAVYQTCDCDYATNTLIYTFPDGLDVEVLSRESLEAAAREAVTATDREHVTSYIRMSGKFRLKNVENPRGNSLGHLRWTVDRLEDLEFVREVYGRLGSDGRQFWLDEILALLRGEPHLTAINNNSVRNEGYLRSLLAEPMIAPRNHPLDQSVELRRRSIGVIPSGSQTFSKSPSQFVQGVAPNYLVREQGSHVWDADDNEYIEYSMGLGPVILGHGFPDVIEAVKHQLDQGVTFSLPHPLEVEVGEQLCEIIPCGEMVRFGKNGSDATAGAIRVARAYTGREVIACCGYHGWQDWFIGTTTRNRGVPKAVRELTVPFQYNDIASLERIFAEHPGEVAAVIMEPVGIVEPANGFLASAKEAAHREGALLIFDEIVTGFRVALGGAQEYFGVAPDIACFGKAIANGFPLSAVVGRRAVMELFDEIFYSFTFGGEALSLAAAKATIACMRNRNVIGHLWELGERLRDGYNYLAKTMELDRFTSCKGLPPRTVTLFHDVDGEESLLYYSLFQQECLRRNILFTGGHNICFSHSEADIDRTLRVYKSAMEILAQAIAGGDAEKRLMGSVVQPVFRRA